MKKVILIAMMALFVATPCFAQLEATGVAGTLWGDLGLWDDQVIQIGFFEEAIYICPLDMEECEEADVLLLNDTLLMSWFAVGYNGGVVGGFMLDIFILKFGLAYSVGPDFDIDTIEVLPISIIDDDWTN